MGERGGWSPGPDLPHGIVWWTFACLPSLPPSLGDMCCGRVVPGLSIKVSCVHQARPGRAREAALLHRFHIMDRDQADGGRSSPLAVLHGGNVAGSRGARSLQPPGLPQHLLSAVLLLPFTLGSCLTLPLHPPQVSDSAPSPPLRVQGLQPQTADAADSAPSGRGQRKGFPSAPQGSGPHVCGAPTLRSPGCWAPGPDRRRSPRSLEELAACGQGRRQSGDKGRGQRSAAPAVSHGTNPSG